MKETQGLEEALAHLLVLLGVGYALFKCFPLIYYLGCRVVAKLNNKKDGTYLISTLQESTQKLELIARALESTTRVLEVLGGDVDLTHRSVAALYEEIKAFRASHQ